MSLACGLVVAHVLAVESDRLYVTPVFSTMDQLELEDARAALNNGGTDALRAYLQRLDKGFNGRHLLLSAAGNDLITGTSYRSLLPQPPATGFRGFVDGEFRLLRRSEDGRYWFAAIGGTSPQGPMVWPYFAVCIVVTTGLSMFSLLYLVFPLRRVRDAMSRFGRGDLTTRVSSRREDEIGQLAGSFDIMAERIEHSFRTERLLLQDISHELRAPLARLGLAIHLAKGETDGRMLQQVESNVLKLSALVGEITEFHQRWSTVEDSSPLVAVDLQELIQGVVQQCAIEAEPRRVAIDVKSESTRLESARPELVERIVENILRNAISHSPPGSRIEVSLVCAGANAVVIVRDFGPGVAPEHLERIFDPFYRSESAAGGTVQGLGLGLSIARRGAQWHGGSLHAENTSPGLRVIASFPVARSLRNGS